ncbi:lysosomal phospholipase A and acyltransferase-like [Montipora foliosa]|uniref:lysosomal phospholipase A and acyltransferase-like n=1 Tax=Montipora foliosa TaxID=591990 RepID=UPI0035F1E28A
MQARRFLLIQVLLCVVVSTEGFWPWSKPPKQDNEIKTPVILVPGSGGSQLEAKLNKPTVSHWYCRQKTSHYFTLWVQISLMLPFAINCWVDNMKLVFDKNTNKVKNAPGVDIRVPGFGDTNTIEHLDQNGLVMYFAPLVTRLVSWGYERGVTVRAAPYDYRYGPESQAEYYTKLKHLIEETYSTNENKKITLMTHSLGSVLTLVFLNKQTSSWKDKYILQWIAMAGPFGGSFEEFRLYINGNTLFVPHFILNPLTVRREQRTDTSNIYLLPSPELWSGDEVLVKTPKRNYTVNNYDHFFEDIGFPLGKQLRKLVGNFTYPLSAHAPNVTVYCLLGSGVPTAERFSFGEGEWWNTLPEETYGDGDGVVNLRSLRACDKWDQRQVFPVTIKQFPSVGHIEMLADEGLHNYVKALLF